MGGTVRARFWYGPDGQRYKRDGNGKKTLYLGNVEIEVVGGVTTIKRTVAGVLQQNIVGSAVTGYYLWHDHLGSLARTTNASGVLHETLDYRHFGYRRSPTNPTATTNTGSSITSRGFTGHEHIDVVGIDVIHMNGRIYDPALHRFLQADPVIQAPGNLQSWNAYTYVFNNPLKYTDPTGMFGVLAMRYIHKKIGRAVIRAIGPEAAGAAAGIGCAFTGPWAPLCNAAANYEITRAMGGSSSDAFRSGVIAAFSSYVGGQIGSGSYSQAFGQAMLGGITAELQGGKFGNGFVSAGLTSMFMPQVGAKFDTRQGRIVAGAILGGTISTATGGKFANGAMSGALQGAMMGGTKTPRATNEGSDSVDSRTPAERIRVAYEAWREANIDNPRLAKFNFEYIDMEAYWDPAEKMVVGYSDGGRFNEVDGLFDTDSNTIVLYRSATRDISSFGYTMTSPSGLTTTGVISRMSGLNRSIWTIGHEFGHGIWFDTGRSGLNKNHSRAEYYGYKAYMDYVRRFGK